MHRNAIVQLHCFNKHFPAADTHRGQLVLGLSAGIHEGLGDDGQRGIHYLSYVHVKDEVGVFQDVNPESQGQTTHKQTHTHKYINKPSHIISTNHHIPYI